METITIKVKSNADAIKVMELLKKQTIEMEITKKKTIERKNKKGEEPEELLDKGLLKAMEEGKSTKFVSKASIIKKLRRNESKISPKV